jgi:hypothetical protein
VSLHLDWPLRIIASLWILAFVGVYVVAWFKRRRMRLRATRIRECTKHAAHPAHFWWISTEKGAPRFYCVGRSWL